MTKTTKSELVRRYYLQNPSARPPEVAKALKVSIATSYRIRQHLRDVARLENSTSNTPAVPPMNTPNRTPVPSINLLAHASIAQALKRTMSEHAHANGIQLTDLQGEALEVIATNLALILSSTPNNPAPWKGIASLSAYIAETL